MRGEKVLVGTHWGGGEGEGGKGFGGDVALPQPAAFKNATTPTEVGTVWGEGRMSLLDRQDHFFAAFFGAGAAADFFAIARVGCGGGVE